MIDTPKEFSSAHYPFVCVIAFNQLFHEKAQALAARHQFIFHAYETKVDFEVHWVSLSHNYGWMLFYDDAGVLTLSHFLEKTWQNFSVDFLEPAFLSRLQRASMQSELLLKALGKKARGYRVFDATLGLGRDSLILASHCGTLVGIERNPIVYCLVKDAYLRAQQTIELAALLEKIVFLQGDAKLHLDAKIQMNEQKPFDDQALDHFDVIYLDPMFPARKKSALVKKNMQVLHALFADARPELAEARPDAESLFLSAKVAAQKSVIVKRPLHGDFLAGAKPSHSLAGKDSRYDIYPS